MSKTRTICVEGWRNIPHSYAIASMFKMLELLRRPNIQLSHVDVPYISASWRAVDGMFDAASENAIRSIAAPAPGDKPDVIYRIAYPYDFAPSAAAHTCVFGTAEFRRVSSNNIRGGKELADAMSESDCIVATSSEWSRAGYLESGADPSRVFNIGLGYDPTLFHPVDAAQRAAIRAQRKVEKFTFLNLGAMTGNKGVHLLLKAFAQVAMKRPHVQLLAKGMGALYQSRELLQEAGTALTPAEVAIVQPRLHFVDATVSFAEIAKLYQCLDAYVTPYHAEGFNMPALEAAACGMPVICTRGGSTDDFTRPDFALHIDSIEQPFTRADGTTGTVLMPNIDHLIQHMLRLVDDPSFAAHARVAGPAFTSAAYTWKHVVDRLLNLFFPGDINAVPAFSGPIRSDTNVPSPDSGTGR